MNPRVPTARPRILIITRNLPPLVGGMERLNWHMAAELARFANVTVIAPEGSAAEAPPSVQVVEVPLRPLWRFLLAAAHQALRIAVAAKPQVVLAGSGLTAPISWLGGRCARTAVTAAYTHGLDLAFRNPVYRLLWLPALRRMDHVLVNSAATEQLALDVGIPRARTALLQPGVALPVAMPDDAAVRRFRERYELGDNAMLLSVGRLTQRKGLREFVSEVLPAIVAVRPDALLVVIGDEPLDALHARGQTVTSIREAAAAVGVGEHLRFLGRFTNRDELGLAYRAASVHVFPVREIPGDPEGFGMVAVEAAAYGLPTVATRTGGTVDSVADGRSGHLVAPGDAPAFAGAVLAILGKPLPEAGLRAHAARFAWPLFGDRLHSLLLSADQTAT